MQAIRKAHVSVEDYRTRNSTSALIASAEKPLKHSPLWDMRQGLLSTHFKISMDWIWIVSNGYHSNDSQNSSINIAYLDAEKYNIP